MTLSRMLLPLLALAWALVPASVRADREVTLEKIMAHPDWLGRSPENFYWADDGESFYYERKVAGSEERKLHQASLTGEILRTVVDGERGAIDVEAGSYNRDFSLKVYERHGDIYLKDLESGEVRQLTRTVAAESDPLFMADGSAVAYERGEAFFARQLAGDLEYQIADVRLEEDPDEEDDSDSYLEAQQTRLFDYVRTREEKQEAARERELAEQQADPSRPPLPFYLGEKVEISTASLSPNGRWLLLGTLPAERDKGERTPMPMWVTESGDIETREVRVKVGSAEEVNETLLLLDLEQHTQHELDVATLPGIADDPLADLREAAEARQAAKSDAEPGAVKDPQSEHKNKKNQRGQPAPAEDATEASPEPRPINVRGVRWSRDGEHLALTLRSRDNKDRWIATVDFDGLELRSLHHLHDPAWINWRYSAFGWLLDDSTLYYLSEEGGYSGLYTIGHERESVKEKLAGGAFVVSQPQLTRDERYIYYRSNAGHPGVYEIYRVDLGSGDIEQITSLGGVNSALLSPGSERLLIEHSTAVLPPELYVQETAQGAAPERVTETVSSTFQAVDWTEPGFVEVPSSHVERPIRSRLYLPADDDEAPGDKRPAVMFVHGAGYLQNAHQGWSGYFREFMFHTLLSRRGYVVLDMDYRASAGYGRDWRTAIYRRMGTPELEDLQDGVAWLIANHDVDPDRIGVYGGSYGGFMALMALFKDPELFAAGAALRPVANWAHYNHGYTSNILNTPDLDPEAYARSSPIEFAAGLAKPLLICAPMLDDNVFFQDTVLLVQKLIELEKTDFETALFPVEPHGFREPSSWLNEYRRIYALFERYVRP